MDSLTNKTAVVTGAASGMGRAFAERLAKAGMRVVLTDVEEPALRVAEAELRATGASVLGVVCDVSSVEANEKVRDAAIAEFGQVNVVCLNAGVGGSSDVAFDWVRMPEWQWVMGVNFWGVLNGLHVFLPHLASHGDGHVVATASMAGHIPLGFTPYTASKFAVVGIMEGLYHTLHATNSKVGVSCLCPGWVNTGIDTSTRNRPEWAAPSRDNAGPTAEMEARSEMVSGFLRSGLDPAAVADLVHDAVLAKKFWIFTSGEFNPAVVARHRAIEAGTNPEVWSIVD
jgi:NAD(P)-dependent dehydrogenase (short-subunit alcohol dehydrogenase family)